MTLHRRTTRGVLLGMTALAGALAVVASPAAAQQNSYHFDVPAQPLGTALREYSRAASLQVIFVDEDVRGRRSPALSGTYSAEEALQVLLAGTDLKVSRTPSGVVQVAGDPGPQGGSAGDSGADVEALIVTAQKREEAIQDVPIAISAFSQKALEEQKIEGGFDLLKAIPNVTFSKSNFSGYNFSIRGIGTKAISATTDPGVAVAFNNTTLIQNRLFEQEYFDIERVEVLRGPQGTLYGRNATSGVINIITAKPKLAEFEGSAKAEIGSYDSKRLVGMLNIPIVQDMLAVRVAGAMTQRTGYDYNEITGNNVNGRDLWSARVTVGFEPTDRIRANLLWERFEEDDNRSRTSKQLCHRDPGKEMIGNTSVYFGDTPFHQLANPAAFSQGCQPGSLYDDAAFGAPNGLALPFVFFPTTLGADCGPGCTSLFSLGYDELGIAAPPLRLEDPYRGLTQSRDLRTVASIHDPVYRAKADLFELSLEFDLSDSLTLISQTARNEDQVYSFQDYNRFNSFPIFTDTSTLRSGRLADPGSSLYVDFAPGGVFCDPQLGCSDRIAGFDISQAQGTQFSQELRLQSDFDGAVNFSLGANYTAFETEIDYYVMYNLLTYLAITRPLARPIDGGYDLSICRDGFTAGDPDRPAGTIEATCPYVDPNPVETINGDGHNYFRSRNPYELESKAVFGEIYWNIADDLKLTAGLRYTHDEKTFTPVPSQVLLAPGVIGGGTVSRGYPEKPPIVQEWGEWTGRLGVDWKPLLPFTDETMVYGFYSRGYKGGGANPPTPGFATRQETYEWLVAMGKTGAASIYVNPDRPPVLELTAVDYGPTFEPEFVNAFEVGAKNTLLGGGMTVNTTAFYYDYKDYQVSQIKDRTAVNENFDATIWGLELETVFAPSRDFRVIWNLGYLDTQIADGETSIDIMNRTQSNPNYVVLKPWVQLPSNCVLPLHVVEATWQWAQTTNANSVMGVCGGATSPDLVTFIVTPPREPDGQPYDYRNYPELNGGAGLRAELGGNELPNAPHWTTNIGAQYGRDILDGSWRVTLRSDAYWQSQSWARVYNAVNDKLHGWYNVNVSVKLENEGLGLDAEFYVKNLLDKSPITDAFINSDDSALTTNVFVLDPRIVGFSLRKTF